MANKEKYELVAAIDTVVDRLTKEHMERRSDWYFHDFVPWERGESFRDKPWDVSQCTISEDARTSLVLNLLTEDNLPYYHALIEKYMPATPRRSAPGITCGPPRRHSTRLPSAVTCSPRGTVIPMSSRMTARPR